jgi:hypothetical protein
MTVDEQTRAAARFYGNAAALLSQKGRDYAPEDVVFLDVMRQAADAETSVEQVMWILLQKHLTAVRRHVLHGYTMTESIASRLVDAANFLALMAVWDEHHDLIIGDLLQHLSREYCSCTSDDRCDPCRTFDWARKQLRNAASIPSVLLSRRTQRTLDLSAGASFAPLPTTSATSKNPTGKPDRLSPHARSPFRSVE